MTLLHCGPTAAGPNCVGLVDSGTARNNSEHCLFSRDFCLKLTADNFDSRDFCVNFDISCSLSLTAASKSFIPFLDDRSNGRAYATVLRLSSPTASLLVE